MNPKPHKPHFVMQRGQWTFYFDACATLPEWIDAAHLFRITQNNRLRADSKAR